MRNVAEIGQYNTSSVTTLLHLSVAGLNILHTLLQKFSSHEAGPEFFKAYFLDLMQHVFAVVTDTSHTASQHLTHSPLPLSFHILLSAGLTMHATILACMFSLVENESIGTPLYDPTSVQVSSNTQFVQEYVAQLIKQAFPHLQE